MQNIKAYIMLVCASLFWAGNFMIGKYAFLSEIPPLSLVFYRWLLVWIILLPFTYKEIIKYKTIILNKKQSKIIMAGIAALKREELITWVWIKDKYVNELYKPTLVNPKKNNKGKLLKIVSLYLMISLNVKGNNIIQTSDQR